MHADVAGVDIEPLAGGQTLGHHLAREVEEDHARASDALQDEARAAEEAGSDALLPGDLEAD